MREPESNEAAGSNGASSDDPRHSHSRGAALSPRGLVFIGLGGLALGPILITLGEHLGWPASLAPYFFFGGWAILLTCVAIEWRRGRAFRQ